MKEFNEQMIADRRFLHAHPEEGWCGFDDVDAGLPVKT